MKNFVLSTLLMLVAGCGVAFATTDITVFNVPQPVNDTLLFALPIDVNHFQHIQNYPDFDPSQRMMRFQPEYLVTSTDFSHGDITKGTPTLPAYAKVIGLALDGYDAGSDPNRGTTTYLEVNAWCKNIPDGSEMHNYDEFEGNGLSYGDNFPDGQRLTDENCRGYHGQSGIISHFDPTATATNPATIVNCPFNVPDENGKFIPFIYTGESIYLTLFISNYDDIHLSYNYMTYDEAETDCASLMRSGGYCFSSAVADLIPPALLAYWYDLPEHRLPAFRTPYFTSDVRIDVPGLGADVELWDLDNSKGATLIAPDEDGNYYSLDHNTTYTLVVDGKFTREIMFDDMYSDINVVINKDMTAVNEIGAQKTVANVAYYNLAGQMSDQPVDGVNIVVTTFTDGTRTTAKVIK